MRQRSRLRWLGEGDANTKLFNLVANDRKTKNFIPAITMDEHGIVDQEGKEEAFHQAYAQLQGRTETRNHTIDLDYLGITSIDLSDQDAIFLEEEIWAVIKDMPVDRALGPGGFIGLFFQKAWEVIKGDVIAAMHKLFLCNGRGFGRLNQPAISRTLGLLAYSTVHPKLRLSSWL